MGKKSARNGRNTFSPVRIESGALPSTPRIQAPDIGRHFHQGRVSISLRYYQSSCECFSDWEKAELKKFTNTIKKISGYSSDLLQKTLSLCDRHKGEPRAERFSRPEDISHDVSFHEIKVDPSNKLRIHGFFDGPVFFLVWLDRKHACFPQ
jgi:hypothetical protein